MVLSLAVNNTNSITCHYTNDPKLRKRYFNIRKRAYNADPAMKGFSGWKNETFYDENSVIFLIKENGKCIGGARLTLHYPGEDFLLPLEQENFRLFEKVPTLQPRLQVYGEISRVAILPEYRNGEYSERLFQAIYDKAIEEEVSYLFATATPIRFRRYRQTCQRLGLAVRGYDITVPMKPEFNNVGRHLLIIDFCHKYKTQIPVRRTMTWAALQLQEVA